jgi:hypothetical protein
MTFSFTFDEPTLFLVLYQHVSKKATVIHKYSKIPLSTIYNYINEIEKIRTYWNMGKDKAGRKAYQIL